jgi:hypothetical protein
VYVYIYIYIYIYIYMKKALYFQEHIECGNINIYRARTKEWFDFVILQKISRAQTLSAGSVELDRVCHESRDSWFGIECTGKCLK